MGPLQESRPKQLEIKRAPTEQVSSEKSDIDETIWQNLPDQLLISILTRLPLPANFQMRRVCKLWNSTLQNLNFLKECPRLAPLQEPFCVMATDSGGSAIFSPAVHKWSEFPQSWLSGHTPESEAPPSESFEVVGAAGGVLLVQGKAIAVGDEYDRFDSEFDSSDEDEAGLAGLAFINSKRKERQKGRRSLSLFNPLNKSRRRIALPRRLRRLSTSSILGVVFNRERDNHKIIMAHRGSSRRSVDPQTVLKMESDSEDSDEEDPGDHSDYEFYDDEDEESLWTRRGVGNEILWTICSYDLRSDRWELAFTTKREYDHILLNATVVGEDTYLLMLKLMRTELGMYVPFYRVFKAPWKDAVDETTAIPDDLGFAKIFENRGRLMLAGWTDPLWDEPKVTIWELAIRIENGERSQSWLQMLQMPADLVELLYKHQAAGICFDAEGDFVCFSNQGISKTENVTITCNLLQKEWKSYPCQSSESCWVNYGPRYVFEPKLDVVV
ncbi:unnamed protein product [Calypogeia fissa]